MVRLGPDPSQVQGSDFGVQAHIATSPGIRLGTPAYIPPEQAFGKPVDVRSDLYSVGVLLFEMLTGHQPFSSDTERGLCLEHLHTKPKPVNSVNDALQIDPQIEFLLLQLMAKTPDERPESARAVIRVIDEVLSRLAPSGRSETVPLPVILPSVKVAVEEQEDVTIEEWRRPQVPSWIWGALFGIVVGAIAGAALML